MGAARPLLGLQQLATPWVTLLAAPWTLVLVSTIGSWQPVSAFQHVLADAHPTNLLRSCCHCPHPLLPSPLPPMPCHFRGTTAALNALDDDKALTQALADLPYVQLQPLRTFLLTEVRLQGARSIGWKHPTCCPAFSWFRGCNRQTEPSHRAGLSHMCGTTCCMWPLSACLGPGMLRQPCFILRHWRTLLFEAPVTEAPRIALRTPLLPQPFNPLALIPCSHWPLRAPAVPSPRRAGRAAARVPPACHRGRSRLGCVPN